MKSPRTLLRIDTSARLTGSRSRELADTFQEMWSRLHPGGRVLTRDLTRAPVPHLTNETIAAFQGAPSGDAPSALELSDKLIGELEAADDVLISCPVYNFGIPSSLKAYFDHVVRNGRTLSYRDGTFQGKLGGKRAYLITARGAADPNPRDQAFTAGYVQRVLRFLGILRVEGIEWDGTAGSLEIREERRANAQRRMEFLLAERGEPEWIGEFSDRDREEIAALREGQAAAIRNGDAEAYAELCADDILLMIPGHDIVAGRNQLLAAQHKVFSHGRFSSFEKHPVRVERRGDLAFEVGRQEVTPISSENAGIFAARQKYVHLFRRTPAGWRFALLTSNPRE